METKAKLVNKSTEHVSYGSLFRFYLPLAIQAASQTFTYPLVAAIASHGDGGPLNLAGMDQAMLMMSMLGMLGAGLVTTGMVHGNTKEGFARFRQVNWVFTGMVLALMALLSIPSVSHCWLGRILGLPASIEHPAYQAFVFSMLLQILFFLRNPYQVCLLIHGATTLASTATITRIAGTLLLIPVFIHFGLVGPIWAVVAQAVAVSFEVLFSWYFARPYIRQLPHDAGVSATRKEMLVFTLPLSAGAFLLTVAGVMIAWGIVRTPHPEQMLVAYYLAAGLAGPAAVAAARVQTVVLTTLPRLRDERKLKVFTLLVGLLMGGVPLLFILPGISGVYYEAFQRCPPELMPLVRISALGLLFHPLMMAVRGYLEGKAAFLKQPGFIFAGQATYCLALTGTALVCIARGIPGNLLPGLSFFAANCAAAFTMQLLFARNRGGQPGAVRPEAVARELSAPEIKS